MPEATVLYSVTAVVIAGLVLWVAFVLKTAKEPWARQAPSGHPLQQESARATDSDEAVEVLASVKRPGAARIDADSTARATPVALSEGRARAAAEAQARATEEVRATDSPGQDEAAEKKLEV